MRGVEAQKLQPKGKIERADITLNLINKQYGIANMAGENPATSDGTKCTGQSHQVPGQQLGQVGARTLAGYLPIESIVAEHPIKPFVIECKNWLFSNTPKSLITSAQVYSSADTAKANCQEPDTWWRHALERLPQASCVEHFEPLPRWWLHAEDLKIAIDPNP